MTLFVFDLDGTLIDSRADIAASANHARTCLGFAPLPEDLIATFVGDGLRRLLERAFDGERANLEDAAKHFVRYYGEHPIAHTTLYPGIQQVLDSVRRERLAILSNKPEALCHRILECLGIHGSFARIAGGDSYPNASPHRAPSSVSWRTWTKKPRTQS